MNTNAASTFGLFVLLASVAVACGKESGPPGPHGGDNTLDIVLAGEEQDFESVTLSLVGSSTGALTLRTIGAVDPIENAIDDEYSLQLEVRLDPVELAKLTLPADVAIGGTARFQGREEDAFPMPTFEPASGASAAVTSIFFSRSCFCGAYPAGEQGQQGRLRIVANDERGLQGSLQLEISGMVPNSGTSSTSATIDVVFDLAITSGS